MNDQAPNYMALSPRYVVICASDSVLFCGEDDVHLFEGQVYVRAIEELRAASVNNRPFSHPDEVSATRLEAVMKEFAARGLLSFFNGRDPHCGAYWENFPRPPVEAEVALEEIGTNCSHLLSYAFRANGLQISASAAFLVVATDDYLRPEIAKFADRDGAWLLAKPVGHTIWIGPLFRPGKSACYSCVASAQKTNRWLQSAFSEAAGLDYPPQPSVAALPSTVATAAGIISTAAAVFLAAGAHPVLENNILSLDTRTMCMSLNSVRRRADCPDCAEQEKASASESLHRFVSPITGIVSAMQVTDAAVGGVFHASADFVQPACIGEKRPPLRSLQSLGKGLSAYQAETCCIAEALERYSIVYQGTEWKIRKRLNDADVIVPNDILLFSDAQFRAREMWNLSHSEQQWVPEPIDSTAEILFTHAKSAVTGDMRLVPAGLCYMQYTFPNEPHFCSPDTNGCSAGRSFSEALLTATLELIERDSVAIWWYNRLSRPCVDLESFSDLNILDVQAAFKREGRNLHLLDITSDLGISAYAAVAPALDGSKPYFGCAAHTSPRVAALKAIIEVAQICFWSERGLASPEMKAWLIATKVQDNSYLQGIKVTTAPIERFFTTEEAIQFCIDRLRQAGIELLYVDLTRPEVGVPVVRAIAPGLRHFWARFRHGRLYDVPVFMGWQEQSTPETELNPTPCMI
jgi:bacteriocin biosynthesis cyclodehydratase domain-containing protein